jgi:uncharacterized protein (DUF927 family)
MENKITVLEVTLDKGPLAKSYRLDGGGAIKSDNYSNIREFLWHEEHVNSIHDLYRLLQWCLPKRHVALIRGRPTPQTKDLTARTNESFPEHPEGTPWVMLDIDGVSAPDGVTPSSLEAVKHVIGLLPAEFRAATCVYQFSNSSGIRELDGGLFKEGIRVHLFFYLDRSVPGKLMAAYLEDYCYDSQFYMVGLNKGDMPMVSLGIDMAPIKTPVQLHYTAEPQIGPGVTVDISRDERLGLVAGSTDLVVIPEINHDLPDTVGLRRQQIREGWAVENGFAITSKVVLVQRQHHKFVTLSREGEAVISGRVLTNTKRRMNDHTLQLFFEDEKSPGSWRVHRSRPWLAVRYGDELEIPLEELCPDAVSAVRELGWMGDIIDESEANIFANESVGPFTLSEDGVVKTTFNAKGVPRDEWLSSPLKVVACIRDMSSQGWSYLVRLRDKDHQEHDCVIPAADLSSERFRNKLLEAGAQCNTRSDARHQLAEYIQNYPIENRQILLQRIGWADGDTFCYVLPDEIFGETLGGNDEQIHIDKAAERFLRCLSSAGMLGGWKTEVGALCAGNSILVTALAASFLPPLLKPLGLENIGLYIRGSSSTGKTKALMVASSVWGDPRSYVNMWRTTDNALETLALARNDALLTLDELAMMQPLAVAESIYMLGNGQGKARMRSDGTVREITTFRLVYLSAGEITLQEHLAVASRTTRGGQEVRFIDIPADAGAGMGIFQELHGIASSREMAERLEEACSRCYGTPIREFLRRITASPEALEDAKEFCHRTASELQHAWQVPNSDPQVQRVCRRLAYVAAVGELAIHFGILPFTSGHAAESCHWAFLKWIEGRGGLESSDLLNALTEMENALHQYGFTRFDQDPEACLALRIPVPRANPSWGYLHWINNDLSNPEFQFWIPARTFEGAFAAGVNKRQLAKLLVDRGFMLGEAAVRKNVPGIGQQRVYVVKGTILGGEIPTRPQEDDSRLEESKLEEVAA